ncbi:hypothetical protein B0I35DRAFT_481974 [Stachybotrys elegans]|uniref:BZIP domain-containing protein n=1 Tax=Stachybotrys elegans TaxID=80388 RepID=A0A8K0SKF8_9HYPO|nr:hypothetical protein B0I35DRAFT_481974 [Stachybotrys elegans]
MDLTVSSLGSKEDPKQRRRGQLRRAQQVYRERKENYIKSLEKELARTQYHEAQLMSNCQELQGTLHNVTNWLYQRGIDVPPDMYPKDLATPDGTLPVPHVPHATSSFSPRSRRGTSSSPAHTGSTGISPRGGISPKGGDWPVTSPPNAYPQPLHTPEARVSELDQAAVGMEFVLKIEEPCLGHIHGNPEKPDEPNGHALTATAHLLCVTNHEPPSASQPLAACTTPPSVMDTSSAILQRLLTLAPDLTVAGELTPIQAWDYLRSRPQFGGLDMQRLRALGEALRDTVKCHGFGAVIQKNLFEQMVFEHLVVGHVF